jgi:hypothetical protein
MCPSTYWLSISPPIGIQRIMQIHNVGKIWLHMSIPLIPRYCCTMYMPWSNANTAIQGNTEVTHVEDRNYFYTFYIFRNKNVKLKYNNSYKKNVIGSTKAASRNLKIWSIFSL